MRKVRFGFLGLSILLLVSILSGCSNTPINQSPNANFSANPTQGEAPLEVSFDASTSSDPDGNIISYEWSFGDGSSSSGIKVNHTYKNSGNYSVQLTVTDSDGLTNSTSSVVTVESGTLSPPSWIIGEWADQYNTVTFRFSSENVIFESPSYSVDFGNMAESYNVEENVGSSSYTITLPPEASLDPNQDKEATFVFDQISYSEISVTITIGAVTYNSVSLYRQ